MKISSRLEYGMRALLDLAQHHGPRPVQSRDIAARQQIPEPYLHQIFLALRRAGLVRSFRGPRGGYRLARPPARIPLAEAVGALEDSLVTVRRPPVPAAAGETLEAEILAEVWRQVEAAISGVLESITLEDLCQRKLAREEKIMYHI
jgi:Rrf2 family protein